MEKIIVATNRKARHDYHLFDTFEAGIELLGSEVKSLRESRANLKDAYVTVREGEVFLIGAHISTYSHTGFTGHVPRRDRRLLLQKREIRKLNQKLTQKGFTAVPLKIYFNERGWAKVEFALARGKRSYDKKETLKKRDIQRELQREGHQR
ncbi:MAG: SsrA-binding protein SmpB [Fidelibacterota bacterium]